MKQRRKPQEDDLGRITAELDGELRKLRLSKLRIGRLLVKARPLVQHGGWIAWVEARGLTDQTARNYMRLAKSQNFRDLPDDADPTYREAGLLADLSEAEPEADPEPVTDDSTSPEPIEMHVQTGPVPSEPTNAAVRAVESLAKAIDREGDSWRAVVRSWDPDRLIPFCGTLDRVRAWADEVLAELKEEADADSSRHAA